MSTAHSSSRGIGEMDDHRVSGRPPLQRVDPCDRVHVRGVRAEPVHRLGREGDDLTGAQQLGGARDARLVGGDDVDRRGRRRRDRRDFGLRRRLRRRGVCSIGKGVSQLSQRSAGEHAQRLELLGGSREHVRRKRGAGGAFHFCASSQSRTNCLSKLGGLLPGRYCAAGQKREESGVSASSIR
jgi:hypothetical protein